MYMRIARIKLESIYENRYSPFFLPVAIVDSLGKVLSTGIVTTRSVTYLRYENSELPVFARLTLPNGTIKTKRLPGYEEQGDEEIVFLLDGGTSTPDRRGWSSTRIDHKPQLINLKKLPEIEGAWLQLWNKPNLTKDWEQLSAKSRLYDFHVSHDALIFSFRGISSPSAVVLRLNKKSPQIITLPPHDSRIMVTFKQTQSEILSPQIMVGEFNPTAEAIMEFLRRGRLGAANTLMDPGGEIAKKLLSQKHDDPLTAVAAGYYLLRTRDWERMPLIWLENLSSRYNYMPDSLLILAAARIEQGMPIDSAGLYATKTLNMVSHIGTPIFEEAKWIIRDLLSLSEKSSAPLGLHLKRLFSRMLIASPSTGLSFSYRGFRPDCPMSVDRLIREDKNLDIVFSEHKSIHSSSKMYEVPQSHRISENTQKNNDTIRRKHTDNKKEESGLTLVGSHKKTYFLEKEIQQASRFLT